MDIDTLTIKDARDAIERGKEIETLLGSKASAATATSVVNEGLNIVILDRGFVYVGDVTISGDWLDISNAKNVRRWGTTEGLGELALKGPQSATKLDMGGSVRAPLRAVVALIKCEASSWSR